MKKVSLIIPLLFTTFLYSGTTGKLTGVVTEAETGQPLPGCNIIIEGTQLGAASDMNGRFFILNIPPGTYTIKAVMIGYTAQVVNDVRISTDLTTTINFKLAVEVIEGSEVTVVAERSAVQMDLTSSEARITSDQMDIMPVNEIWDVISAQAGITKDAGGGIHIRGGRSREVAYWVDGVSVTDAYDGGISVAVDNNSIQELQVISGTFNAEYGQAMSGIINLVTKDGGQEYDGYLSVYSAGYATRDSRLKGLDKFDPRNELNLEGSLGGPIPLLGKYLTFYTNIRRNQSNGWLNGWRVFDKNGIITERAQKWFIDDSNPEPEIVHMNARQRFNTNTKLTLSLMKNIKLRFSLMTSDEEYQDYRHEAQWSPEGELRRFNVGRNKKLSLTHTLSSRTFYTFDLAEFSKNYYHYAYKSVSDTNYIDPFYWLHEKIVLPLSTFKIWGVDRSRFNRETNTRVVKFDLTSQISSLHQVKFGAEYRTHDLSFNSYNIEDASLTDTVFTIRIPGYHQIAYDSTRSGWTIIDTTTGEQLGWDWKSRQEPSTQTFATKKAALEFEQYFNKYVQFGRGYYNEKPEEFSAYIQDKIEFKSVIINIGLRWDYFNSHGVTPTNPAEPYLGNPRNAFIDSLTLEERDAIDWSQYADYYVNLLPDSGASLRNARGWWTKAQPKQQFSPRLGIAYPITDKGVIHFSFGHFFQIPSFERLYRDPGIKIPEESGKFGVFGNPSLNPQKTVMYELGLRQEIFRDLTIDVTGYYRDVRDWVSTGIPVDLGGGASYFTYVNKDYSNVRGLTINLDKRFSNYYGFNLNYMFQVAEGSNSNPDEEFGAIRDNREPTRSILPLDWDQTHTFNGSFYAGMKNWTLSLLGQFGSGLPYTPTINIATTQGINVSTNLPKNSRRKPITYNLDMNFIYRLPSRFANAELYVKVFNLFDRRNELTVFSDTGRATHTFNIQGSDDEGRPNTIAEFYARPDWFSAPRQVQLGFTFSF